MYLSKKTMHILCKKEKHKRRDNRFGVTWCILCGRLFNKSCGKRLTDDEIEIYKLCS